MTTSIDPQLIEDNLAVLRQGRALLDALDDGGYTRNAPSLSLSGVGPHLRHVLDFYARFLGALETAGAGEHARIDYDLRDRDERIERDPVHAGAVLDATAARLAGLTRGVAAGAFVEVKSDGSPWIPSTVDRELQSLVSHTVHHYALIAVAVRAYGGDPGTEFGVAPSTLRHWQEGHWQEGHRQEERRQEERGAAAGSAQESSSGSSVG